MAVTVNFKIKATASKVKTIKTGCNTTKDASDKVLSYTWTCTSPQARECTIFRHFWRAASSTLCSRDTYCSKLTSSVRMRCLAVEICSSAISRWLAMPTLHWLSLSSSSRRCASARCRRSFNSRSDSSNSLRTRSICQQDACDFTVE